LAAGISALVLAPAAGAEDLGRIDPEGAKKLAERYSPIIMLKGQDEPCDTSGESYGPTAVDIVLDNPEVLLRQVGRNDPVMRTAPGASDLFELGEGFYLDFPGGSLEPGCIYERDFERYSAEFPAVVYAHVVQEADHPDQLALQYWFYWYYNDWNNKHESDWEGIQLLFEASSIEEALASEPVSVGYAQHEGGERASWDASKLERDGDHPVVYSSAGSHASYFSSAVYMGRSASEGFGCDNTDGPSDRYDTDVVVLPDTVDDATDPLAWLAYEGRWGERQNGAFNGPTGPVAKERWLEPVEWHEELRPSSVVIPAGDSFGERVIGSFCSTVEWGSRQLILLTTSPLRLLISAVAAGYVARFLSRRTDWSEVSSSPVAARRRGGQIIRAAFGRYRQSWPALVRFGAVWLPAVFVAGLLSALLSVLPVIGDLLGIAGDQSGSRLIFAATAGSLPQLAAAFAVNAMVASYFGSRDSGPGRSPSEAIAHAWARRRPLASTFGRALLVVSVLAVSVIGIPWAIRQWIRYQFSAQAVMLEDMDGPTALRRSTNLVEGRWWHTAIMVSLFNLLPGVSALLVGLLVLLGISGLPLWIYTSLMTLVYAAFVPLTAIAQLMLYGDAAVEHEDMAIEGQLLDAGTGRSS
jgi:hypothetical protein